MNFWNSLKGFKTYAICLIAIVYALTQFYGTHSIDSTTMIQMILTALGASGLRNAIN